MIGKSKSYKKQEEYEAHFSMNAQELTKVAVSLENIKTRT